MSKICGAASGCPFAPEQTTGGCPCAELCPGYYEDVRLTDGGDLRMENGITGGSGFVARDCFDRILVENDLMREQLASIGKKPGDSMDDVRRTTYGKWISVPHKASRVCSRCLYDEPEKFADVDADVFDFCPHCGAIMSPSIKLPPLTKAEREQVARRIGREEVD